MVAPTIGSMHPQCEILDFFTNPPGNTAIIVPMGKLIKPVIEVFYPASLLLDYKYTPSTSVSTK